MLNCPNCGALVNDGEAFCGNCGVQIVPPAQAPNINGQSNYQQQIPNWPQTPYQPSAPYAAHSEPPVGVGDWFVTLLLMGIPIVNLVMLFIWAFGSGAPESKSNFAKAQLIWMLIGIVLSILVFVVAGASLAALLAGSGYYGY